MKISLSLFLQTADDWFCMLYLFMIAKFPFIDLGFMTDINQIGDRYATTVSNWML